MVALVTGGRGFIGRHTAALLAKRGDDVRVLDAEQGGILNHDLLREAISDVNEVYHLGACSGNLHFRDDTQNSGITTNVQGTVNVLEAARRVDARVVFASTMSAYAGCPIPHFEQAALNGEINLYTATKIMGEWLCSMYHRRYGLHVVPLRFSSVYGPGEESKGPVANPVTLFIRQMLRGEAPVLYGDGTQTRDLIFVEDVARAAIHAAGPMVTRGETYNVCTQQATRFIDVVSIINRILGTSIEPSFAPFPGAGLQVEYVSEQLASNEKFRRTGWVPQVQLWDGVQRAVEYFRRLDTPTPEPL